MKVRALPVCLALILTTTSCTVEKPAEVNTLNEAKAVQALSQEWLKAEIAKDIPTIMSFYAEDAMEMASNTPVIIGKEPIQKWYETWLKPEGVSMSFATEEVKVATSLDQAVERGTYHFIQNNASGQVDDTGKYVTVWKKVKGEWKVMIDTATSDLPCQGGAPAAGGTKADSTAEVD
jgi:uncharacterized protein (TIGR02246 family)